MPRAFREAQLQLCATVAETCAVLNLRKAARAVSNLLDAAMRPTGLRSSQFALLVALALEEEATVSRLARLLGLDRTTMTRNLEPLERDGLLVSGAGEDARNRVLHLTDEGRAALARALPIWERVQARVVEELGATRWKELLRGLKAAALVARSG